ncbi:MAG: helix-turn-helix domain-containing protein [Pseudomonadota bacterium]
MTNPELSPFMTVEEAADYLRMKVSTLDAMRWRHEGPNYRKHGAKVLYHRDDLEHWSRSRNIGHYPAPANDRADNDH